MSLNQVMDIRLLSISEHELTRNGGGITCKWGVMRHDKNELQHVPQHIKNDK